MEIGDAGVFSVAVGAQHAEFTLVVKESPLWFTSSLALSSSTSSEAVEGGRVVMEASLNKRGAKVTWQKDDFVIEDVARGEKYRVFVEDDVYRLAVSDLCTHDAGAYSINAGEVASTLELQVAEIPVSMAAPVSLLGGVMEKGGRGEFLCR